MKKQIATSFLSACQINKLSTWRLELLRAVCCQNPSRFDELFPPGQSANDQQVMFDHFMSEALPQFKSYYEELSEPKKADYERAVDIFIAEWEKTKGFLACLENPTIYKEFTVETLLKQAITISELNITPDMLAIMLFVTRQDYNGGFETTPTVQTIPQDSSSLPGLVLLSDHPPTAFNTWEDARQALQECSFGRGLVPKYFPASQTLDEQRALIVLNDRRLRELYGSRDKWLKSFTESAIEIMAEPQVRIEELLKRIEKQIDLTYYQPLKPYEGMAKAIPVYTAMQREDLLKKKAELKTFEHYAKPEVHAERAVDEYERRYLKLKHLFEDLHRQKCTSPEASQPLRSQVDFLFAAYIISCHPEFPAHLPKNTEKRPPMSESSRLCKQAILTYNNKTDWEQAFYEAAAGYDWNQFRQDFISIGRGDREWLLKNEPSELNNDILLRLQVTEDVNERRAAIEDAKKRVELDPWVPAARVNRQENKEWVSLSLEKLQKHKEHNIDISLYTLLKDWIGLSPNIHAVDDLWYSIIESYPYWLPGGKSSSGDPKQPSKNLPLTPLQKAIYAVMVSNKETNMQIHNRLIKSNSIRADISPESVRARLKEMKTLGAVESEPMPENPRKTNLWWKCNNF
jgi:hypothetical protein